MLMKTKYFLTGIILLALLLAGCEQMEDNYKQYLENVPFYPPKVLNLTADEGLKEVKLYWDNPKGEIAKKILIDYQDDSLLFETMVDSAHLEDLEIKGYTIFVYTLDSFNNRSVPETLTVFPNGEN